MCKRMFTLIAVSSTQSSVPARRLRLQQPTIRQMWKSVMNAHAATHLAPVEHQKPPSLRAVQVLARMRSGETIAEMAMHFEVSRGTIKADITRLNAMSRARNRMELFVWAERHGYLPSAPH